MNYHFCTEDPCPEQEKELAAIFNLSTKTHYINTLPTPDGISADGMEVLAQSLPRKGERIMPRHILKKL